MRGGPDRYLFFILIPPRQRRWGSADAVFGLGEDGRSNSGWEQRIRKTDTGFARTLVEGTLSDTPITVIQGARQVGKSTLARTVAGPQARVVSLDAAANYNAARADPDAFVRQSDDFW
jgi:hypothetical protein